MILIDTQATVWFFNGSDNLGPQASRMIDTAIRDRGALVAPIMFWEVSTLYRRGRINLVMPVQDWTKRVLAACILVELTPDVAMDAGSLPEDVHGDPADRILMATARAHRCPLLTSDGKILRYAATGLLQAIDARR